MNRLHKIIRKFGWRKTIKSPSKNFTMWKPTNTKYLTILSLEHNIDQIFKKIDAVNMEHLISSLLYSE
jgi:hypothetical protein